MNKPLIITMALGVLLLALGSWLYLFLYGAPQSPNEVFTDLGIVPDNQQVINPTSNDTAAESELPIVDVASTESLRQLTLRNVAGFSYAGDAIRYVEQGTGHVYEIDSVTGAEERISNTTIPSVTEAVFGLGGSTIVFVSELPDNRSVQLGTVINGALDSIALPPDAENFIFTSTSTLVYTRASNVATIGYEYDVSANAQRELFAVPFGQINTQIVDTTSYVTTRSAVELEGALFTVSGRTLAQVGQAAFGLHTLTDRGFYAQTFAANNELTSQVVSTETAETEALPIIMIPAKCNWWSGLLYCASPLTVDDYKYVENWHKGIVRSADVLWRYNPLSQTTTFLVNPETAVGRPLDMTAVSISRNGALFINRLDNTLWLYEEIR